MSNSLKDKLSYRSFVAQSDSRFKQFAQKSDLCDCCEQAKSCKRAVISLRTKYKLPADITYSNIIERYKDDPDKDIVVAASFILECAAHRELADTQALYNEHTAHPKPGKLVVDADWRARGCLPISKSQTSGEFYHKSQVSMLGVGFYWLGPDGRRRTRSVDIVSRSVTEDSHCTI